MPGLPTAQTMNVMPVSDGSLWVGQVSGPVHVDLRRGVATAYGRESGLQNLWISSIAVDPENRIWAGTGNGLYRQVHRGGRTFFAREELPQERGTDLVYTSLVDHAGRLWVGTWGGLLRLEAGRWTRLTTSDGLLHNRVSQLAEAKDGSLWVGYAEPLGVSHLVSGGGRRRGNTSPAKMVCGRMRYPSSDATGGVGPGWEQTNASTFSMEVPGGTSTTPTAWFGTTATPFGPTPTAASGSARAGASPISGFLPRGCRSARNPLGCC